MLGFNKAIFFRKMGIAPCSVPDGRTLWPRCRIEGGQSCSCLLCRCSAIKGTSASSRCQKLSEFPVPGQIVRTLKTSWEDKCCQFHNQFPWLCPSDVWCQQGFVLHPFWCHTSHRWKVRDNLLPGGVGDHYIALAWLFPFSSWGNT